MTERREKPYYLRQPWDILFRENKLDKVSPWSVNLVQILATLLQEMERVGIDFRIAGTAVNSSVMIYLRKAELLVEMGEIPEAQLQAEQQGDVYLPPALPFPFRFDFTTTSVQDLIAALERALQDESRAGQLPRLPTLPIPVPNFLDFEQYLLEIESRSEELYERLKARAATEGKISLRQMFMAMTDIEAVRTFMMILFLAQRNFIDLDQDEEETDVLITVREDMK